MFRGSSETRMDEKSRLKIPSAFRRVIDEHFAGEDFFVTSTVGDHARLYPISIWREIEAVVMKMSIENPTRRRFLYHANYYGMEQQLDAQGRLVIQAPLRNKAELQGEVIVIAMGNFLEVWNRERFQIQMLDQDPFTTEDSRVLESFGV